MASNSYGPHCRLSASDGRFSKQRIHADATAAKLTNKSWALVSALKKLEWENHRKPLDCGSPSNAALCIVNPLRGGDFFINMFSTHPPMEVRIKALEKL